MALAIDTRYLLDRWIPDQEGCLDTFVGSKGRFQVHRVCAYATITQNSSSRRQYWDDLGDEANLNHHHDATTTTTLVASVQSPTFLARVQGLPRSYWADHRYCVKMTMDDRSTSGPQIVWANATDRCDLSVVWRIQLDFVDLLGPILTSSRPTSKRRRRTDLCEVAAVKKRTITSSGEEAGDLSSSTDILDSRE